MYWNSVMAYAVNFGGGGGDIMLQNQKIFPLLLENMLKGQ